MNPEEILTILRIESLDEVEDAIEMELFELKKSILAKPLLRLTLKSKFTRLDLLAQMAESRQLYKSDEALRFGYDLVMSDEVLVVWEGYMKARSQWKIAFTRAQTPRALKSILEEGLNVERIFSEQFKALSWTDEEPVFGLEPDPMLIQNGLKQAARKGWLTFADLEKNKNELEKDLLLAIKRLSLLPKYL